MRRILAGLGTASLIALAGCATTPTAFTGSAGTKSLSLERDFAGRSYATGVFTNAYTGSKRPFTTVFDGSERRGVFSLSERISFVDGERDHVTWRFTKVAPDRYRGTREDVVGAADIVADGRTLRLSYDVILPGPNKTQVHFEDVIGREADGRIVNRAVISKFGVRFGTVDIAFSRHPARPGE